VVELMRRLLAFIVSLVVVLNFVWVKPAPAYAAIDYSTIRVKLDSMGSVSSISVIVQGSYTIKENSSVKLEQKTYTVKVQNGSLVLTDGSNSWNLGSKFTFKRNDGNLRIKNSAYGWLNYLGDMEVRVNGSCILLINEIHLELYLYGVVPYEMSDSWPLEALKAQAVAARTYAANKIRANQDYALVDNEYDQVYKGYSSSNSRSIQAVDATRGQVLKYNGSFAETFYSSSNGGLTERAGNIFSSDRPYLKVQQDDMDLNSANPNRSWTVTYYKTPVDANLQARLKSNDSYIKNYLKNKGYNTTDFNIKSIKELRVDKYTSDSQRLVEGTLVLEVDAKKSDNTIETIDVPVTLTKNNTRSLLNVKSLLFTITAESDDKGDKYVIKGSGFGHGVGMSQFGAYGRAQAGHTYSQILAFYFPGTNIETLNITAPGDSSQNPPATPDPKPTPLSGYGTVKASTLNVRKGPGTEYSLIGTLKSNEKVEVIGESGQWYQIKFGNTTGYVSKSYIAFEPKQDKPQTPVDPAPPSEPALPPSKDEKKTGVVTASALNIRSGPGTNNKIVGVVVKGKKVTVHEKVGEWYKISYNGINGYVHSSYIKLEQSQTPTPNPSTTPSINITSTLRRGSKGSEVKALQQYLNQLGYNCGTPDGIFGTKTEAAVKAFQKAKGLTADGIVGPKTRAALNGSGSSAPAPDPSRGQTQNPSQPSGQLTATLRRGSKGSQVVILQQKLNKLGYNCGTADGIFGAKTEAAVKAFQKAKKLTVDGIVGAKTRAALNAS